MFEGMTKWIIGGFFLLTSIQSLAQHLSLRGKVEHRGAGVSQCLVVLNDSLQGLTDRQGNFRFKNLKKGRYKLLVTHVDYKPLVTEVYLVSDTLLTPVILEESKYELNEVVVKDKRGEQTKRQYTFNSDWVNQEFIRQNLSGSLMQTLEKLPGVNAMYIGSGQSKPQIRGLGFNQVAVVDGGLKHEGQQWGADHGLEIDQFAVGSVEVVKGPASFLYGSDAIGGVIRVNPTPPPALHQLNLTYTGALMTNSMGITNALVFNMRKHKWYTDARVTFRDYGDYKVPTERIFVYDYEVLLPKGYVRNSAGQDRNLHLTVGRVTEKWHHRLAVSNVFNTSGFFANAHGLEPRRVNSELHDQSHRDILLPSQKVNHFKALFHTERDGEKRQWEMDLGYQINHRQEHSAYVNHGYMPVTAPEEGDLERKYFKQVLSGQIKDKFSVQNHELQWGAQYEFQHNRIGGWGFLIPAFEQHLAGIFLHDKWQINKEESLQFALRFDHARIHIHPYQDWFPSLGDEKVVRVEETKRNFSSFNASLGWRKEGDYWSLSSHLGSSFRVPLAKELAANGVNYHYFRYEKGNPDLDPEKSYQWDAGIRGKGKLIDWEITPYFNYFPNYIYLNPTADHDYLYGAGNQIFQYEQSKVMRYGTELVIKAALTKQVDLSFNGDYLYSEQLSGSKKGFTLPFAPPPSGRMELTYKPWTSTYFRTDVKHVLAQNRIVPPEKKTPEYTLWGMAAGTNLKWGKQPLEFSVQWTNILNTRYLNHTSFYRLIDLPEMGSNINILIRVPLSLAI
ncbi:TonB-dependent receptor [Leadbetterella byssophila DSM 17132]|uniref:TonB-dependent receptor n=2 Tax=Leadbetterella TaxID=319458 RepID=E4RTR5_LEAB4|nr:TonB-dependent receptor [Leadbetterella byssophila DSM 17132]